MKRVFFIAVLALSTALSSVADDRYKAALVIEPTTRQVLFAENPHQPLPVASMTKMMTLLIAMERIEEGSLKLDEQVTISANASKMGGSQVYLRHRATFPVQSLLAATMIHSANDAATALAEHIAGTESAFVTLMNQKAQTLGMKNSRFFSPHGLPSPEGQDDVMSPMDAAILGMALMKYPLMQQYAATPEMPFKSGTFEKMYNPNHLLRTYPGATGIKTGYHGKAGFCVTASAKKGDMSLIAVVMGSPRKQDNFGAAADLLSENFAKYKMVEVLKRGQTLQKQVPVQGGDAAAVAIVAGADARLMLTRQEEKGVTTEIAGTNPAAPIKKGQHVGWIFVKKDGKAVGRVPALAANEVPKEAWWKRWWPF